MQIALVHPHFDATHLESVKSEMMILGAPTIKAVWMECYGMFAALEGCHRIRAAAELGLIPEIEEIEYSDEINVADLGLDGEFVISSVADDAYNAVIINFEE